MHVTWLVANPDAFFEKPGPTSPQDQILPFRVTYQEWLELFFVVLQVDEAKFAQAKEQGIRVVEFEASIPGYPMLSRIRGPLYDVEYAPEEVESLEEECSRLLPTVSNPHARNALETLLKIAAEAKKAGLNIYLMCQ